MERADRRYGMKGWIMGMDTISRGAPQARIGTNAERVPATRDK